MARKGENIHKRKDGRWEARIVITINGVKKTKSIYARSYRDVKAKLLHFYADHPMTECQPFRTAADFQATGKTFSQVAEEWFLSNKMNQKASTQLKYHHMFDNHILPAFGNTPVTDIDEYSVNSFLAEKKAKGALFSKGGKTAPLSSSYVRTMGILIRSVISYAVMKNYRNILKAPITMPAEDRKTVDVLSAKDLTNITQLLQEELSGTVVGIAIALNAGLRIGEICALRWSDIDFEARIIHVRHTIVRVKNDAPEYRINGKTAKTKLIVDTPKTKTSLRDIPVNSRLLAILVKAKENSCSDYVISDKSTFLSPRTYEYRYHKFLQNNGITDTNFHVLRHTFSTRCVEADVDIKSLSEMLGHSNVSTTLNIYVHSSMELKRSHLEKLMS